MLTRTGSSGETVSYVDDFHQQKLRITVLGADGLVKRDNLRLPDPFAVVTVDDEQTCTTGVIKNTVNPCWNASFDIHVKESSIITVQIHDQHDQGHLGTVHIHVWEVLDVDLGGYERFAFDLDYSGNDLVVQGKLRIHLSTNDVPGRSQRRSLSSTKDNYGGPPVLGPHDQSLQQTIDKLSKILASSEPSTETYAHNVRRLRRLCRNSGLLPSSARIHKDVTDISARPISQTAFSDVWRGKLDGRDVAVKALRVHLDHLPQVKKAYLHELVIWQCLRHPNIVPFIGTSQGYEISLISLWMEGGTVAAFLREHPDYNRHHLVNGIVKGLSFMHSLDVVHGDIKPENILVDHESQARLTDFGLATTVCNTIATTVSTSGRGTLRYMAPELLDHEKYGISEEDAGKPTKATDLYALAMTTWQIFSEEAPFANVRYEHTFQKKVIKGDRPALSDTIQQRGLDKLAWARIVNWWDPDPAQRSLVYHHGEHTPSSISVMSSSGPSSLVDEPHMNFNPRRHWSIALTAVYAAVRMRLLASSASARFTSWRNASWRNVSEMQTM